MNDLRTALRHIRDSGYQPMYNGRPSCPFCHNFVDDEETHEPSCPLLALSDTREPDSLPRTRPEWLATIDAASTILKGQGRYGIVTRLDRLRAALNGESR